jgi:hypothetical protein
MGASKRKAEEDPGSVLEIHEVKSLLSVLDFRERTMVSQQSG